MKNTPGGSTSGPRPTGKLAALFKVIRDGGRF
jgi:hypothetical protein